MQSNRRGRGDHRGKTIMHRSLDQGLSSESLPHRNTLFAIRRGSFRCKFLLENYLCVLCVLCGE